MYPVTERGNNRGFVGSIVHTKHFKRFRNRRRFRARVQKRAKNTNRSTLLRSVREIWLTLPRYKSAGETVRLDKTPRVVFYDMLLNARRPHHDRVYT